MSTRTWGISSREVVRGLKNMGFMRIMSSKSSLAVMRASCPRPPWSCSCMTRPEALPRPRICGGSLKAMRPTVKFAKCALALRTMALAL